MDSKLRVELGDLGISLVRSDGGVLAGIALAAAYEGEHTVVIGLGGLRIVRPAAVVRLAAAAAQLVEPWGTEGRVEFRSLRPAVRRTVLACVVRQPRAAVTAIARRGVVIAPAADEWLRARPAAGLSSNRGRMLLLAHRDGSHCVWCRKALTYRSADATVDHVVCRSHGGSNALENLVLSCARCNHRRADRLAEAWLQHCLTAGLAVDTDAVEAALVRARRVLFDVATPARRAA